MTVLSLKSNQSIDRYVAEINRHPLLTREQELELARQYQSKGDLSAAHELVVGNLRFVVKIAHEYKGYGLKLLDLIQEGNIGLMMAVKKFDAERGYRLISYAVWWIRAYIHNFVLRSWSLVKLGTTQGQRKLFFKLRSERDKADREAGPGETADLKSIADRLQLNETEVAEMEMRMAGRDFSLDAELEPGSKQSHLDLVADNSETQHDRFAREEERQMVRGKVGEVMQVLNEKERYIVSNRLMAEEPKTLQEIGAHFSISRERARQIEGNVMKKLKVAFTRQEERAAA